MGSERMSYELKDLAGFGKEGGQKNFSGILTELQMQTYLIMSRFAQKRNKRGQPYGWHIAAVETPETKWGYAYITSCYKVSGGNQGCTMKGVVSVDAAFQSADLAMAGISIDDIHGINASTPEETMRNMGLIASPGMEGTERTIMDILEVKQKNTCGEAD